MTGENNIVDLNNKENFKKVTAGIFPRRKGQTMNWLQAIAPNAIWIAIAPNRKERRAK